MRPPYGSSAALRTARTQIYGRLVDLSSSSEYALGDARARSRHDVDDPAHRLREGSRRDFRLAVRRPFLCDPADRLARGQVRAVGPRTAGDVVFQDQWAKSYPGL